MTLVEQIIKILEGTTSEFPILFEDILEQMPQIHYSDAQMMAVYRSFRICMADGYIIQKPNMNLKRYYKYAHQYYFRTDKPYLR